MKNTVCAGYFIVLLVGVSVLLSCSQDKASQQGASTPLTSQNAQDANPSTYDPWIGCWTVEYVDGNIIPVWLHRLDIDHRAGNWTFTFYPVEEADVLPRWRSRMSIYYTLMNDYTIITHRGSYEIDADRNVIMKVTNSYIEKHWRKYETEISNLRDAISDEIDSADLPVGYYYKLNNSSLGIRTFGAFTVKQ